MYRPGGFKDLIKDECHCKNCKRLINLGADAMYNALWKMAEESPTKTFTLDANIVNIPSVFIPEE